MKFFISERYKAILFHISLWSLWLFLSLSNSKPEEFYTNTILVSSLIILNHIPLFFFNTRWLIPNILLKKNASIYFWVLILVLIIFSVYHAFLIDGLKRFLEPNDHDKRKYFRGVIAIIVVGAVSTGYGLLGYISQQEKNLEEQRNEQLQSELLFLRSQISPHFIFNVLNSIVYLIRSKSELAEPVTIKLSELMRYMLYESDKSLIALEKEIAYLESYIALQKIRFEEDVAIDFKIEGKPTHQIIEPMILIPFVENAFKHGVGMVMNPVIDIDLKIADNHLFFSVKNKIGVETKNNKDETSGIGLRNLKRRLELLYPNAHSLDISQKDGFYFVELNLTLNS